MQMEKDSLKFSHLNGKMPYDDVHMSSEGREAVALRIHDGEDDFKI